MGVKHFGKAEGISVSQDQNGNPYPNPTTGTCTISIPVELMNEDHLTLQVFDVLGTTILQAPVGKNDRNITLNLEGRPKGIYNAIISNGKKIYSGKIIYR